MTTPDNNPDQQRHTAHGDRPIFVASVRPFDNRACTDNHPLARVRYGRGLEFVAWRFVRHDGLLTATGRRLDYWLRIDGYAEQMITRVAALVSHGHIPPIADFAELHQYFDPGNGWGTEIDALAPPDFVAAQWRFTDWLRTN